MVVVTSFEEFHTKGMQIFAASPNKARYVLKYRHQDGKLVLKVTDDIVCVMFKTDQASDVKALELFDNELFRMVTAKRVAGDEGGVAGGSGGGKGKRPRK